MNDNYLTGLFDGMSNADYHAHIHIGSSGFKLLERSPLHFFTRSPINPDRDASEATRLMNIGTAWHTGIWEPQQFADLYAVKPDISAASTVYKLLQEALEDIAAFRARYVAIPDGVTKTSKEGKALLAELEARGKIGVEEAKLNEVLGYVPGLLGKMLFNADDYADVVAMSAAANAHPTTRILLGLPGASCETSIFWIDRATGAPCRIRPDYMCPPCDMFPTGLIVDGKTCDDASDKGFGRTAWNMEMFYQAAFYSDGYQAHFGTTAPPVFAWLAQERDKPYATKFHSASRKFVEFGRRRYRPLLAVFAECLRTGQWPGYPIEVTELSVPGYAAKEIDALVPEMSDAA